MYANAHLGSPAPRLIEGHVTAINSSHGRSPAYWVDVRPDDGSGRYLFVVPATLYSELCRTRHFRQMLWGGSLGILYQPHDTTPKR
jgi:hypothetical protein